MDTSDSQIFSESAHRIVGCAKKSLLCLTLSFACLLFNGCAVMRDMMIGDRGKDAPPAPVPVAPPAPCAQPNCSAPFQVTGTNMTAMPVGPGFQSNGQGSGQGNGQGYTNSHQNYSASGRPSAEGMQPQMMQASPATGLPMVAAPPGYVLVPVQNGVAGTQTETSADLHVGGAAENPTASAGAGAASFATPPAAVPPAVAGTGVAKTHRGWPVNNPQVQSCDPHFSAGSMHPNPSSALGADSKLQQCEKQVSEMSVQINTMKEMHSLTREEMRLLLQDQLQLKNENESLRRKLEKSDEQYLRSLDALSQILEETIPPSSAAEGAVSPPAGTPGSESPSEPVLLPAVESEL